MSPLVRQRLRVVALSVFSLAAIGAQAQLSMHVTPVEIAQLPQFCWAQLQVPNATGDAFIYHDCGPAANHYCGAVLSIMRAKHETNKYNRLVRLSIADTDLRYTERAIADYPKCSIRDHVASTRAQLNNLVTIYGGKRPGAQ